MRFIPLLILAAACGGMPPPNSDGGTNPPDGGSPTIVVAMSWFYFTGPAGACAASPYGNDWSQRLSCADGQPNADWWCSESPTIVQHCCTASAIIRREDLATLINDYPNAAYDHVPVGPFNCERAESAGGLALSCGTSPRRNSQPVPYTNGCAWTLPYAVH